MKRILGTALLAVAFILVPSSLHAEDISLSKAKEVAEMTRGQITFTKSNLLTGKYRLVSTSGDQTLDIEIIL